jgi:hypothetical protein
MLAAELPGPWRAYRHSFVKALRERGDIGDAAGLQIARDFQPALWDNPTYGEWLAWESVANIIPAWGATYVRSSGNRVTDAIQQFLTNLDVPGTGGRSALRSAPDTHGALSAAMEAERRLKAGLAVATALGGAEAVSRVQTLAATRDRIWTLSQQLVREREAEGGDRLLVAKALLAFNNPAYQVELTDDHGGRLPYRSWMVRPALSAFLSDARAGRASPFGFAADLQAAPGLAASIGPEDMLVACGFLRVGRSTALPVAILGAVGSLGSPAASPCNYQVTLEAKSFAAIDLMPGPWYSQDVIRRFSSGPFLPQGPFGAGLATFWGEGGVFPYTPQQVFAAFQPSIRATMPPAAFEAIQTAWSNGEAIGLGPLEFNGRSFGSADADEASFDDASMTFGIRSRSSHAIILAVNNRVMP